jgi:glycosyltransferase involved in cell wall biosynthesis
MNILLIHNYYKIRGGEDSVFENEAKELEKKGHRVIRYSRHNAKTEVMNIFQKIYFLKEVIYSKITVGDLKKIFSKEKIDIAHIHNTFPLVSPSAYRFLKKKDIKIVQTIHNYRFLCPNGLFYRKGEVCTLCKNGKYFNSVKYKCYKESLVFSFLYFLILKINRTMFKDSIDGFIALTDFTKNIFIEAGFDKNKIFVKGNGLEDKKIERVNDKRYFLYLGRLSKEKGLDFLLESFSRLPDMKLIIAGSSENKIKYNEKYKNKLNINFYGFADDVLKEKLIKESIALILPSVWYENYPVTITEAFRAGIPVVGSKIGGIPFIVSDNKNGMLFETENFEDFKSKLEKLWKDKDLRKELGDNARSTFVECMEFSRNIKTLEEIYRRIINGKN